MYQVSDGQFEADRRLIAAVLAWKASYDGPHQDLVRAMGRHAPPAVDSLGRREQALYREVEAYQAYDAAAAAAGTSAAGYPAEASR